MLICPHCHAENPASNRFCHSCGEALSHSPCPSCGEAVERSASSCPHCGAVTGHYWRVIITAAATTETASSFTLTPGQWLDTQQRYQLQTPTSPAPSPSAVSAIEATVIDQQPLQLSPLDRLRDLAVTLEAPELMAEKAAAFDVPPRAYPYLALAEVLDPAIPRLHDAWQTDEQTVLLLDDRRDWLPLANSWADDQVDSLQMVWWLHEMTRLWGILQPWQSCSSLLDLTNLCVDEDQILCLRQLYHDATYPTPPTLSHLGDLWQQLLSTSSPALTTPFTALTTALTTGAIATLPALQTQLAVIADTLQTEVMPTDPLADPTAIGGMTTAPDPSPAGSPTHSAATAADEHTLPLEPRPTGLPDPLQDPAAIADDFDDDDATAGLDSTEFRDLASLNEFEEEDEIEDSPTVVLPMRLLTIEDAGSTDVGQQRKHNEDTFSIQLELQKSETPTGRTLHAKGLYILCDGMGGHEGGEVASALAIEVLRHYFEHHWGDQLPTEASIRDGIQLANKAIFDINQQNARLGSGRMGTTLVMLLLQDTHAIVAHVGDSRVYRYSRRLGLEQVTVDHEVGQREIQRGVEPDIAYARPDAYQLTQALGPRDERFIDPSFVYLDLNEDTLLLLCSDGLSDNDLLEIHSSSHIEPLLSSGTNLERGVADLMLLANQFNGHDNITAIAVRVKVRPKLTDLRSAS